MEDAAPAPGPPRPAIYRHRASTRLWHWVNAVTIIIMIGSGLTILNAHPHLYWGAYGANYDHAWLHTPRWPGFLTIPGHYNLAIARRWHLLFALVLGFGLLSYMIVSVVNRHFQRDLRVRAKELSARHLWHDLKEHLAFRFHDAANPGAYNIFQKLSYVLVVFGLIPTMIFTGLAMSPAMDAAWPWLLDLFGGRQSARSIHFIAASGLVVFIIVHLTLVILAGAWNEVRSMVTGRWTVPDEEEA
ncbi:cytochrome b/b6 domain-containing protein [Sphingomonas immobilis]|uniref:Cytochrome b/b6 domain-containing protein n=1 Tax=Sphingomonas immobilis TaxID=3063997 RepID=A0ABT8ZVB2_9SPHN|nr:cytochrome b/b6 domain-containing protein [Sphingomonas sp. CA1-15]MDO7841525.1 cytochrome b/b6 domain-containing protein [Sphingomonas sp. CA1-15]